MGNGRDGAVLTNAVKGAIAGAAGVWVMDRVGWWMYRNEDPHDVRQEIEARVGGQDVAHAMADKLATVAGTDLQPQQPHPLGLAIHYGLGVAPGAAYAELRERVPAAAAGHGLLYGLALFVLNDEIVAPAIGVASGPGEYPLQAHARGLVSHLVLGVVTDVVLDALDRVG